MKRTKINQVNEVIQLEDAMLDKVNGGCAGALSCVFDFAVNSTKYSLFGFACSQVHKKLKEWGKKMKNG